MNSKAEIIAGVGAVLFTVGLWIERPSLAFLFVGGLLLTVGFVRFREAKQRGQS